MLGAEDDNTDWGAFDVANESSARGVVNPNYLSLEGGNGSFEVDRYGFAANGREEMGEASVFAAERSFRRELSGAGGNEAQTRRQGVQVGKRKEVLEKKQKETQQEQAEEEEAEEDGEEAFVTQHEEELDLIRQASRDHRGRCNSAESSFRIEQAISKAVLANEGTTPSAGSSAGSSLGAMRWVLLGW